MGILRQAEIDSPVSQLCRERGMNPASVCKRHVKYGGMDTSMMVRLKELESEGRQLKDACRRTSESGDHAGDHGKNGGAVSVQRGGAQGSGAPTGGSVSALCVRECISESCYH